MPRLATMDESDLERELLRKAAIALRDECARCADCGRAPLTGERIHVYGRAVRVCELCRPLRRETPERTERVRGGELGGTVRLAVRAA